MSEPEELMIDEFHVKVWRDGPWLKFADTDVRVRVEEIASIDVVDEETPHPDRPRAPYDKDHALHAIRTPLATYKVWCSRKALNEALDGNTAVTTAPGI